MGIQIFEFGFGSALTFLVNIDMLIFNIFIKISDRIKLN